jgi:hypothetical protein
MQQLKIFAIDKERDVPRPRGDCEAGGAPRIVSIDMSSGVGEVIACKVYDDESMAGIYRFKGSALAHSQNPKLVAADMCTDENLEALLIDEEGYETDVIDSDLEKWHLIFKYMTSQIDSEAL